MIKVYLGIGSNLGNRKKNIEGAISKLKKVDGVKRLRVSDIIETDPVGGPKQGKFLNGVIEIYTSLWPHDLLKAIKSIESSLGRVKTVKNGPRVIDIDILLYGDQKISNDELTIPHPRMQDRDFVLIPLSQLRCKK